MLSFSHLREFVVFARYLNISKAADVLYLSQSNLSKHLKQLDAELGFPLTAKKGNQILLTDEGEHFLTDEGEHFLTGAQALLSDYDALVEECRLISQDALTKLTFQDPPYADQAAAAIYEMANDLRRGSKAARILFAHEKHKDRHQLLLDDEMHLLLQDGEIRDYCVGEDYADQIMARFPGFF